MRRLSNHLSDPEQKEHANRPLQFLTADESDNGVGLCGMLLTMISWGLVLVTLPFSLCVCFKVYIVCSFANCRQPFFPTIKVVQEYERAVIFRLGRLLHGGSRGPGKQRNHHRIF